MNVKGLALVSALLALACGTREAAPEPPSTYPPLGKVVAQILAENPGWHLGTNDDCSNPGLKEELSNNPRYQAYRAIPDLNGDRQTDRVFVIIKGDSGKLYWIPGRDGGFDAPHLFATLDRIREGGLITSGQTVMFGRFDSDVALGWKWNPSKGGLEMIPETPPD